MASGMVSKPMSPLVVAIVVVYTAHVHSNKASESKDAS